MRTIQARELLAQGRTVLNGWSTIPGGFLAEAMASLGWDAPTIDRQHGIIGQPDMVAMLQAISTTPITPMVRLAANDARLIGQALNAGVMGVICPHQFAGGSRELCRGLPVSAPGRSQLGRHARDDLC